MKWDFCIVFHGIRQVVQVVIAWKPLLHKVPINWWNCLSEYLIVSGSDLVSHDRMDHDNHHHRTRGAVFRRPFVPQVLCSILDIGVGVSKGFR